MLPVEVLSYACSHECFSCSCGPLVYFSSILSFSLPTLCILWPTLLSFLLLSTRLLGRALRDAATSHHPLLLHWKLVWVLQEHQNPSSAVLLPPWCTACDLIFPCDFFSRSLTMAFVCSCCLITLPFCEWEDWLCYVPGWFLPFF